MLALLCYSIILVVIDLHNLAYFDIIIILKDDCNQRPEKSHVHYGDREVGTQLGTGSDNIRNIIVHSFQFPLMSHSWSRNCISILKYPVDLSTVKQIKCNREECSNSQAFCVIMFY